MSKPANKEYLGDAVYAEVDEFGGIILTTENGISVENVIYLEPEVLAALNRFAERMKKQHRVEPQQ